MHNGSWGALSCQTVDGNQQSTMGIVQQQGDGRDEFIVRSWNGQAIKMRAGRVCLTDLCRAGETQAMRNPIRFSHWFDSPSTQRFLQYRANLLGVEPISFRVSGPSPENSAIIVREGATGDAWGDEVISLKLAGRLSVELEHEVYSWYVESRIHAAQQQQTASNPYLRRYDEFPVNDLPDEHWSVFHESMELIRIAVSGIRLNSGENDLIDGSAGHRWATYRKESKDGPMKPWTREVRSMLYTFLDGRTVPINVYHIDELPHYKRFLKLYEEEHMAEYIKKKAGVLAMETTIHCYKCSPAIVERRKAIAAKRTKKQLDKLTPDLNRFIRENPQAKVMLPSLPGSSQHQLSLLA